MTFIVGFSKVNACLRCKGRNILPSYPVVFCKDCGTIISFDTQGNKDDGPICVKFPIKSCYVSIMCLENKTYIGEYELKTALPFDITESKLKAYLVFS